MAISGDVQDSEHLFDVGPQNLQGIFESLGCLT